MIADCIETPRVAPPALRLTHDHFRQAVLAVVVGVVLLVPAALGALSLIG